MAFQIRSVIEFTYDGGSHPGNRRLIYVLSVPDSKHVRGYDLLNEDHIPRLFLANSMSRIRSIEANKIDVSMFDAKCREAMLKNVKSKFNVAMVVDDVIVYLNYKQPASIKFCVYSDGSIYLSQGNRSVALHSDDSTGQFQKVYLQPFEAELTSAQLIAILREHKSQ